MTLFKKILYCRNILIRYLTWGQGSTLGCGSSEMTLLSPVVVVDLMEKIIIVISVDESHCLALTRNFPVSKIYI